MNRTDTEYWTLLGVGCVWIGVMCLFSQVFSQIHPAWLVGGFGVYMIVGYVVMKRWGDECQKRYDELYGEE